MLYRVPVGIWITLDVEHSPLNVFRLFGVEQELVVSRGSVPCCPESADIAVVVLDKVKKPIRLRIVCFLTKRQELESTQVTIGSTRHTLVEPHTLFRSD